MFLKKIFKIAFINFLVLVFVILMVEVFFGTWFTNNFKYKLSSERNIDRIYKFDFDYHKGTSHYIRNTYGFRTNKSKFNPSKIEIVFVGGSTINQKFINYEDSIVGLISKENNNSKIVNAGIDGMSIKGHINSFKFWFDKIKNFTPKYYIFTLGINDRHLIRTLSFRDHVDNLEESSFKGNLREYLESNSFFYNKGRYIKSALFLKFNLDIGTRKVKKNHVYIERDRIEFTSYENIKNKFKKINDNEKKRYIDFELWYLNKLKNLTDLVRKRNSEPIFITQTTGYGHSFESLVVAETIIKHCNIEKLICLNLAKNLDLNYEDFYDENHLNINGSKKFAEYVIKNLPIF